MPSWQAGAAFEALKPLCVQAMAGDDGALTRLTATVSGGVAISAAISASPPLLMYVAFPLLHHLRLPRSPMGTRERCLAGLVALLEHCSPASVNRNFAMETMGAVVPVLGAVHGHAPGSGGSAGDDSSPRPPEEMCHLAIVALLRLFAASPDPVAKASNATVEVLCQEPNANLMAFLVTCLLDTADMASSAVAAVPRSGRRTPASAMRQTRISALRALQWLLYRLGNDPDAPLAEAPPPVPPPPTAPPAASTTSTPATGSPFPRTSSLPDQQRPSLVGTAPARPGGKRGRHTRRLAAIFPGVMSRLMRIGSESPSCPSRVVTASLDCLSTLLAPLLLPAGGNQHHNALLRSMPRISSTDAQPNDTAQLLHQLVAAASLSSNHAATEPPNTNNTNDNADPAMAWHQDWLDETALHLPPALDRLLKSDGPLLARAHDDEHIRAHVVHLVSILLRSERSIPAAAPAALAALASCLGSWSLEPPSGVQIGPSDPARSAVAMVDSLRVTAVDDLRPRLQSRLLSALTSLPQSLAPASTAAAQLSALRETAGLLVLVPPDDTCSLVTLHATAVLNALATTTALRRARITELSASLQTRRTTVAPPSHLATPLPLPQPESSVLENGSGNPNITASARTQQDGRASGSRGLPTTNSHDTDGGLFKHVSLAVPRDSEVAAAVLRLVLLVGPVASLSTLRLCTDNARRAGSDCGAWLVLLVGLLGGRSPGQLADEKLVVGVLSGVADAVLDLLGAMTRIGDERDGSWGVERGLALQALALAVDGVGTACSDTGDGAGMNDAGSAAVGRVVMRGLGAALEHAAGGTAAEQEGAIRLLESLARATGCDGVAGLVGENCDYVVGDVCHLVQYTEDHESALRALESTIVLLDQDLHAHAPDVVNALITMLTSHHSRLPPPMPPELLSVAAATPRLKSGNLGGPGAQIAGWSSGASGAVAALMSVQGRGLRSGGAESDAVGRLRGPRREREMRVIAAHAQHEEVVRRVLGVLERLVEMVRAKHVGEVPRPLKGAGAGAGKQGRGMSAQGGAAAAGWDGDARRGAAKSSIKLATERFEREVAAISKRLLSNSGADMWGCAGTANGPEDGGAGGGVVDDQHGGDGDDATLDEDGKRPPEMAGSTVALKVLEQCQHYSASPLPGARLQCIRTLRACIRMLALDREDVLLPAVHRAWPLLQAALLAPVGAVSPPLAVRLEALETAVETHATCPAFARARVSTVVEALVGALEHVATDVRAQDMQARLVCAQHGPLVQAWSTVLQSLSSIDRKQADAMDLRTRLRVAEVCCDILQMAWQEQHRRQGWHARPGGSSARAGAPMIVDVQQVEGEAEASASGVDELPSLWLGQCIASSPVCRATADLLAHLAATDGDTVWLAAELWRQKPAGAAVAREVCGLVDTVPMDVVFEADTRAMSR